jgi:hypothetical protein
MKTKMSEVKETIQTESHSSISGVRILFKYMKAIGWGLTSILLIPFCVITAITSPLWFAFVGWHWAKEYLNEF